MAWTLKFKDGIWYWSDGISTDATLPAAIYGHLDGVFLPGASLTNPLILTDSYLPELRRRGGADFRISQLRGRDASAKGSI